MTDNAARSGGRAVTDRILRLRAERDRLAIEILALEDGTLPVLEARGSISAAELAREFKITPQAANNRLRRLERVGMATRTMHVIPGGGREYFYWLLPPTRCPRGER